jgi:hypothetical protein
MAFTTAPCGCPSEGDEISSITAHLEGCGFLEDLLARCGTDDPWTHIGKPALAAGRSTAEKALAETYRRHGADLAELEDAYADDSWRTNWT